jgi:hypothetical protein
LVVDNVTGAAWRPRHSEIYQELAPMYGAGPMYSGPPIPLNGNVQPAAYSAPSD